MSWPVGVEAGAGAGVLQQHQGGQAHDLRLGGEQAQQQAGQPDGLVAERRAAGALGRRIALVEHQVDHRRDGGEALGALLGARGFEGHVGVGDDPLGAGDPLLHGRFRDQEGAGDLPDREAGDDAQGERDLLGRRQVRMGADEQQPQDVVAVLRAVEPLGQRRLDVVEVGEDILGRQGGLAAHLRTPSRPALRPTRISQAAGSRGGPFFGQAFRARRQASWKASSARSRSRK
jgi:hypothetical protein